MLNAPVGINGLIIINLAKNKRIIHLYTFKERKNKEEIWSFEHHVVEHLPFPFYKRPFAVEKNNY